MEKERKQLKNSKPKKKIKAWDIISYSLVIVFFLFSLTCLIFKLQGSKFTMFGNRYDVVLTNSMSYKNEKYKEFLEGHDNQFQAFDLAVSKTVPNRESLKLYDVVIYRDRTVGTNMHRIVGIEETGSDTFVLKNCDVSEYSNIKGIAFSSDSQIECADLSFTTFEMDVYSEIDNDIELRYAFDSFRKVYHPTITSSSFGNGKLYTFQYKRTTSAPGVMHITSGLSSGDYSTDRITSIRVNASMADINVQPDDFTLVDNVLTAKYNVDYRYEIRGDASNTSDGKYTFNEIEAVVVKNIPNAGYFVRFLNSLWGGLMFALLGLLIIVVDIIATRMDKKEEEKLATANNADAMSSKSTNSDEEIKKENTVAKTKKKEDSLK